jgi:hypothetical protein
METKRTSFEPKELDIEIDGTNGIRIRGKGGGRDVKVEFKDENGNWHERSHIRSILIDINTEDIVPLVLIEQYIYEKG